ncbi:hypothetical protein [Sphingomonas sp. CARO-RG-8B-R24-01]|uniref:hypothetical protein n=1 Tax=Sphingomonas sp. CARO-RG-8B-R24-01 TaxID=2914831 RepID=UPI001F58604E|nr:hypothetical protein [Sphingomonas sp. CARO-RG-8B-R24-01]
MTADLVGLIADLAPFSDLGSEAPSAVTAGSKTLVRLVREGENVDLTFDTGGVTEKKNGQKKNFKSLKSLLASPGFSNLGQWADSQKLFLQDRVKSEDLPALGQGSSFGEGGIIELDEFMRQGFRGKRRNVVVLIDGPAGIGKTSIIRALAYRRAEKYRVQQYPLILHVESRGRVLQNITDLMAFSLQTLRASVTYDQIPALVRHGLITLAIDGFDELGDPNGYDLAWAQLNDLIVSARGEGSFLLSGRETFISSDRITRALPSIDESKDTLESYSIFPIQPSVAKTWLSKHGWNEQALVSDPAKPIFEVGSYALRPFFLSQLASAEVSQEVMTGEFDDILSFLVESMALREQSKFGKDVDAVTSQETRLTFINTLMEEVARDLAENQTDSISGDTLVWLSDVASESITHEVRGILRNRVQVIAFLTDDLRRGYKRFIHEQVQNYFLCKVTIKALSTGDIPKYVRRNIFGLDFLENFCEVARHLSQDMIEKFVSSCLITLDSLSDQDRARRNISALVMACCSISDVKSVPELNDCSVDEALFSGTVSRIHLSRCTITQLDARGSDMSEVSFSDSHIITLLADQGTIPSRTIPSPSLLVLPESTVSDPSAIETWLGAQYMSVKSPFGDLSLRDALEAYPLVKLLARYARYRPFWLKDGEEKAARKILDDEHWEELKSILNRHELLVERFNRPSSGPAATFYHLKNRDALRELDYSLPWMRRVISDIITALPLVED